MHIAHFIGQSYIMSLACNWQQLSSLTVHACSPTSVN